MASRKLCTILALAVLLHGADARVSTRATHGAPAQLLVASNAGDLVGKSVTFQPSNAAGTRYSYCLTDAVPNTDFLSNDYPWTDVPVPDLGQVPVGLPFRFTFYGEQFSRVFVGASGYLVFGDTDTTPAPPALPLLDDHWDQMRISALLKDLLVDGTSDTFVKYLDLDDRVVITWRLPSFYTGALNSVQVILRDDNSITLSWAVVPAEAVIVGLSGDFVGQEVDFPGMLGSDECPTPSEMIAPVEMFNPPGVGAVESNFDLLGKTIVFTPVSSQSYSTCISDAPGFPDNLLGNGWSIESLGNDDSLIISLGFDFPFYDDTFSSSVLGSNGYLAFAPPPTEAFSATLGQHFSVPRISGLFADLNPGGVSGGTIAWRTLKGELQVAFQDVPAFGAASGAPKATFTVSLYADGHIAISVYSAPEHDTPGSNIRPIIVGLSPGTEPGGWLEAQDLSASTSVSTSSECWPTPAPTAAPTPAPAAAPTPGPTDGPEWPASCCESLTDRTNEFPFRWGTKKLDPRICAASAVNDNFCVKKLSYDDMDRACTDVPGARPCTLDELENNAVKKKVFKSCGLKMVWTSTTCELKNGNPGQIVARAKGKRPRCRPPQKRKGGLLCCAESCA